jgi:hypothetical protein
MPSKGDRNDPRDLIGDASWCPDVIGRQRTKLGSDLRARPDQSLDQHVTVSEVAEVAPRPAFASALKYPLKRVLALDDAKVAASDNGGIGVVSFPYTARRKRGVSRERRLG